MTTSNATASKGHVEMSALKLGGKETGFRLSGRVSTNAVFDPATLTLNGWWRDYAGGPTWAGTASAGDSGSHTLADVGFSPGNGTALNGHGTALFVAASTHWFRGGNVSLFHAVSALSGWALLKLTTNATNDAAFSNNTCLVCTEGSGQWGQYYKTGKAGQDLFDGATSGAAEQAITTGSYHLVQWDFDGTNMHVWVDGAGGTPSANRGAIQNLALSLDVGRNPAQNAFLDATVAEIAMCKTVLSSTNRNNVKSYINARYNLAF